MSLGNVVLVPLASPTSADWLGRLAAMIAMPDQGEVVAVTVVRPDASPMVVEEAQTTVERAAQAARASGAPASGQIVRDRSVAGGVLEAAAMHEASLVMMGWQGHSTNRSVFGELIDSIMGRSTVPLAVVRSATEPFDRVLLPVSDDHLADAGQRGVSLAVSLAERVRQGSSSSLLVVRSGTGHDLPEAVRDLDRPLLRMEGAFAEVVGQVARATDIVVAPVAPTVDGLRNATTHVAWATPASWQLVAIDVGSPPPPNVVSAVEDAGMVVEPSPAPETDSPHEVEVRVVIDPSAPDPWDDLERALARVGTATRGHLVDDEDRQVMVGTVEIMAVTSAAALAAVMIELDEVRLRLGLRELTYRLTSP